RGAARATVLRAVIDLFLEVLTREPLRSLDDGRRFMGVLEEVAPDWLPGRWGHDEPLSRTWDPASLEEAWSDDELLWKGRGARVEGWVARPVGPERHAIVHLGLDSGQAEQARAVTL